MLFRSLETAQSAIKELSSLLDTMRELAVRSKNSAQTSATRDALDEEFQSLRGEYNRIVASTEFDYQDVFTESNDFITVQAGYGANGTIRADFTTTGIVGSGSLGSAYTFTTGATYGTDAVDVNGDGLADIVATENTFASLTVSIGNGNGTFAAPVSYAGSGATSIRGLKTGDMNNDGYIDV